MNFTTSIKTVYSKYATFKGRASRSQLWWFILYQIIMYVFLSLLSLTLIPFSKKLDFLTTYQTVLITFCLLHFIPNTMLIIRRYHDVNKSAWWYIIPLLISFPKKTIFKFVDYLFTLKIMTKANIYLGAIFTILISAFAVAGLVLGITLFFWTIFEGTVGPNKYGPDPLAKDSPENLAV